VAATVFIALVALLAIRSAIRNLDWRTDETLAHAAVKVSMDSPLALRGLGREALRAENVPAARAFLERSLRLDPKRSEPYLLLSLVYERQGDIEGLIGLARQAAVERRQRKELIHELAGLLWQKGRGGEAEPLFRQVVTDHPDFLPSRLSLGGILLDRGDAREALEHFRAATTLNPERPEVWLGMTMASLALGRRAEARAYADRGKGVGLKLPPNVSRALEGGTP
jgi:Flp pilus assembly protein TadD